ncbi:hypothetical protein [Cellulomonas sp. URHB0016]
MSKHNRRELEAALQKRTLVRIHRRPKHSYRIDGFVVALGSKWVLVSQTMDGGYFNGYVACRVRDVSSVDRDRSFENRFSATRPEWPPSPPGVVDLTSTKRMLRTLAATGPLIGIEKENERSAVWIGQIVELRRGWVALHEVRPDARWRKKALWYRLRAVTSASVGTHYLRGLAAIAGARG